MEYYSAFIKKEGNSDTCYMMNSVHIVLIERSWSQTNSMWPHFNEAAGCVNSETKVGAEERRKSRKNKGRAFWFCKLSRKFVGQNHSNCECTFLSCNVNKYSLLTVILFF